jgi:hypothetical protein
MLVQRWSLLDPVTYDSHTFELNPYEGGSFTRKKKTATLKTAASDGKNIMFEGRQEPQQTTFTGILYSEEEMQAWREWSNKRYQVQLTDDLGRSFSIYIKSLSFDRVRSAVHPWKHKYTVEAMILDW